jgi:hypothetical protein
MFMCSVKWSSVINLDLFWKQSFLILLMAVVAKRLLQTDDTKHQHFVVAEWIILNITSASLLVVNTNSLVCIQVWLGDGIRSHFVVQVRMRGQIKLLVHTFVQPKSDLDLTDGWLNV